MKYLIYSLFFMTSSPDTEPVEPVGLYQPEQTIEKNANEITFWSQRLEVSPMTGAYKIRLAQSYEEQFQLTGDIISLTKAEEIYRSCVFPESIDNTPALLSLSQNLITQHRFCEAYQVVLQAEEIGRDMDKVLLVKYDIEQELGVESEMIQGSIGVQQLIRLAKEADAAGDLNQAIVHMMNARTAAYDANDPLMKLWTTTNLAEFMGHNGNIETSAELLTEALQLDPANWYAYKLLAWIEYAHYNNPEKALAMISDIMEHRESPDLLLFAAELHEALGLNGNAYEDRFMKEVRQPMYGRLYNMDVAEILLRRSWSERTEGLNIMKEEYEQRKTPEVAALLAFAYAQNGGIIKARQILLDEVYHQTFEPVPIALMLEVMKEYVDYHDYFKSSLSDTEFELGPLKSQEINSWLSPTA